MVCEFILGRANFELVHHRPVVGSGQTGLQRYYHDGEVHKYLPCPIVIAVSNKPFTFIQAHIHISSFFY